MILRWGEYVIVGRFVSFVRYMPANEGIYVFIFKMVDGSSIRVISGNVQQIGIVEQFISSLGEELSQVSKAQT